MAVSIFAFREIPRRERKVIWREREGGVGKGGGGGEAHSGRDRKKAESSRLPAQPIKLMAFLLNMAVDRPCIKLASTLNMTHRKGDIKEDEGEEGNNGAIENRYGGDRRGTKTHKRRATRNQAKVCRDRIRMPQAQEETMNIASQSDYNQIRINLMLRILKARQDNDFARADHLTRLLREEMEKQEQGWKASFKLNIYHSLDEGKEMAKEI
ncbi:hypothetical protein SADUNF_Sadunf16G0283900 [Salix dunnii]|uniref:Uncharacterized protein n=1 Tax=Salix dunnii TaxID=1413687 RepID=A0A835JGW8_9ROSI|nr:hypothetical protein SADUNF_Sadunf16G0283900 [Salix dunnii]